MRNERGPKKTGRTGSAGYKSKSTSSDSKKTGGRRSSTAPKKYSKDFKESDEKKPFGKSTGPKKYGTGFKKEGEKKWEKSPTSRGPYKKKFEDKEGTDKPAFGKKPFAAKKTFKSGTPGDKKSFVSKGPYKKKFEFGDQPEGKPEFEKKPFDKKTYTKKTGSYADYKKKGYEGKSTFKKTGAPDDKKKETGSSFEQRKEYKRKTGIKTYTDKKDPDKVYTKETEIVRNKNASKSFVKKKVYQNTGEKEDDGLVRLNKFIANAGICSRREADTYIQTGVVTVNGEIITELGYKVKMDDKVLFGGKPIMGEKPVYIILNKPKDYITTSKDPQNRKTVLDLISGVRERVFPVGRLDRKTTGVLILTNDGPLAEKLMHPRKGVTKIYHVELDYRFTGPDMELLRSGIELEDGFFKPDVVDYVDGMDKHHVGVEIHSGANHIVRRLFEHMKYEVVKLDRVVYAGLTKKGLTRGKWRFLTDSELHMLKML